MACKDIPVHCDNSPIGLKRLDAAARLAERHDAHLTALTFAIMPIRYSSFETQVPAGILHELETRSRDDTKRAVAALDEALTTLACRTSRHVAQCRPDEIGSTLSRCASWCSAAWSAEC